MSRNSSKGAFQFLTNFNSNCTIFFFSIPLQKSNQIKCNEEKKIIQ